MRKDITKKLLMREDRYLDKMLSKAIVSFIFRKKINIDAKQIGYEVIEFRNVFSTEFTNLDTNNSLYLKIKEFVSRNGKRIGFDMIYCEKGTFTMGSDDPNDENPKRVVKIESSFLLGETEVTQELYELVMGYNPSEFKGKYDSNKRPVEMVTWYDAIDFCNKLSELQDKNLYYEINNIEYHDDGKSIKKARVKPNEGANGFRLPLSKEWEYAAKAGTNNIYAGTNDKSKLEEYAWFGENSNKETHPVATKKPNEWNLYDMSGNVGEWCYDLFDKNSRYPQRILRGGCWILDDSFLRASKHTDDFPYLRHKVIGFRVSASLVN